MYLDFKHSFKMFDKIQECLKIRISGDPFIVEFCIFLLAELC